MIKFLSAKSNISIMKSGLRHYLVTTFIIMFIPFLTNGQTVINMEKDGGVYKIPCEINGLRLKLIFDTGAANVCISGAIADMMLENGYLDKNDIKGSGLSQVADGRIIDNTIINIKHLKIKDIELNNVEAVVIHQQSAPLLLGQSAIQRLGRVSIQENKLIINQNENSPVTTKRSYTYEEIDNLFEQASNAMDNEAFELAVEYYGILYNLGELSAYGKYLYADCLRITGKYMEGLAIYKEASLDIQSFSTTTQIWVYYGMMICCKEIGEYNSALQYGQLALQKADFAFRSRSSLISSIASIYQKMGNKYNALKTVTNEAQKYLTFMGIKATDCWDKNYKDPYIADIYHLAYLYSELSSEQDKYIIISAAWGNADAIESANKYYLTYTEKPRNYVY